jgi:hypothetical protein
VPEGQLLADSGRTLERPLATDSVEKLGSRGDPKILKPLQASARVKHEGTPGRRTRLLTNSSVSLDARQAQIDARTLTMQENHIAADLEFFNRIDPTESFALAHSGRCHREKRTVEYPPKS